MIFDYGYLFDLFDFVCCCDVVFWLCDVVVIVGK